MITREQILSVVGDDLRNISRGDTQRTGPPMASKLVQRFGGTEADYSNRLGYLTQQAHLGRLFFNERLQEIDAIIAAGRKLTPKRRPMNDRDRDPGRLMEKISEMLEELDDSPWWQLSGQDRDNLEAAAEHEANHAVVGLALGGTIERVRINADGSGVCKFSSIPDRARGVMLQAGSHDEPCGLGDQAAQYDREHWQKLQDQKHPDATASERSYLDAGEMAINRDWIDSILRDHGRFHFELRSYLAENREISGRALHAWWDDYISERG